MSGIVGILNCDGAPVDRPLLRRMTDFLTFRGPDAQKTWVNGSIGFGHTLLATTDEAVREDQPCTLDGEVWLVADARVDDRGTLRAKLAGKGRTNLEAATDADLILHAYHAWGEDCVQYLLGDFAFAIWDGRERRLFCARDHFGVKPFYYARVGNCLVFSNTLNCVRLHPQVSDELNDLAIADFLLFGENQEFHTTSFADVLSLAPAHFLSCLDDRLCTRRYWTLPENEEIRYKRGRNYIEHFQELMDASVADRLRTDRVSLLLSGGLDSATIAASASGFRTQRPSLDLRGLTVIYDWLIPDDERHYTSQTADALNIPVDYFAADELALILRVDESEMPTPEPDPLPTSPIHIHSLRHRAAHARVALDGTLGDEDLKASGSYVLSMLTRRRIASLAVDLGRTVVQHRLMPQIGFRTALKHWLRPTRPQPFGFSWLNPDLVKRLDLPARWGERALFANPLLNPRGLARAVLKSSRLANCFRQYDPGLTSCLLEVRYPFCDVRLVNYLLAIPVLPWCLRKELFRVALRGKVPETVCGRPKTPLNRDPFRVLAEQGGLDSLDRASPAPRLNRYVKPEGLDLASVNADLDNLWTNVRPRKLNAWLRSLVPTQPPFFPMEEYHENPREPVGRRVHEEALSSPTAQGLRRLAEHHPGLGRDEWQ